MRVALLVPTYLRPLDLARCLEAVEKQGPNLHEVIVVIRSGDAETLSLIDQRSSGAAEALRCSGKLRTVMVSTPGVIAAMQAGLDAVSPEAEIIALTDDDAAPRTDWLARIVERFESDKTLAGVGGRDWQWYGGRVNDGRKFVVGKVQWFGRVIGNHHLGVGGPRKVDILKGANCAFRADLLRTIGFDHRLWGTGAQVHWEMSLCLAIRRRGLRLIYDPAIAVDHFPAARPDADVNHRGGFHAPSLRDAIHNETLILLEHLPPGRRIAFAVWAVLAGTGEAPGFAQILRIPWRRGGHFLRRLRASLRGRYDGWRSFGGAIEAKNAEEKMGLELAHQWPRLAIAERLLSMKLFTPMHVIAVSGFATDFLILAICAFPAWMLAIKHSRWLVPYILLTWAAGPEVRRVNDWLSGGFQSITVVSLIPMVATLALLLPIFEKPRRLSNRLQTAIVLILLAFGYGTIIGVLLNGYGAAFEGLGLLIPFLFVPFAASRAYVAEEHDFWLRSLSAIAALVAGYGWYQFLEAPPWDMQWLIQSGMFSSTGLAQAESFRVFSTVNACGSLGLFMASALVVGVCNRRWRGPLGLIGSVLIGSCLLISQIRLGWVVFAIAISTYLAVQRGANRWRSFAVVVAVTAAVLYLSPMLPGGELVSTRFATFNDLGEDSSVQGRIEQTIAAIGPILSHPFGSGFGATGVGAKLVKKDGGSGGADNGYVDLAVTLGPVMMLMFFTGMVILTFEARRFGTLDPPGRSRRSEQNRHSALAVAMVVAYAAGTIIYNNFGGIGGAMFWLVVSTSLRQKPLMGAVEAPGDSEYAIDEHDAPADLPSKKIRARRGERFSVGRTANGERLPGVRW